VNTSVQHQNQAAVIEAAERAEMYRILTRQFTDAELRLLEQAAASADQSRRATVVRA
jgi:hypothetical protein